MFDLKSRMGASLLIAFVIAILTYALLNPIVSWYLNYVPGFITCTVGDTVCEITRSLIAYVIPIGVLFLCVFSIFEVFSNDHRF